MQPRIAQFTKISDKQFLEDMKNIYPDKKESEVFTIYNKIQLPKRGTKGSAGYDFVLPYSVVIQPDESKRILTGVRCHISEQYVLVLSPRSSVGTKLHLRLDNTIGIIDADYYYTNNEGHIQLAFHNDSEKPVILEAGIRLVQGIFLPYGITVDDDVTDVRTGGFGSTGR